VTYAGSGVVISTLTFYNVLAVLAWWPLVLLGAARGGARGVALGGAACGMALLGGEPVTAALGLVPLLLAAVDRHGLRKGAGVALAIAGLGALIALPQVVASARVLPFSFRGAHGMQAAEAASYRMPLVRLLELVIPLPFGLPARHGAAGFWAVGSLLPGLPYFYSLHAGVVGLWLAAVARGRRAWTALALAGLGLAWAGGLSGELLVTVGRGLFRYPEKFLVWTAIAMALLAGWGLDRLTATRRWRAALGFGLVTLGLAVLSWGLRAGLLQRVSSDAARELVELQGARWARGFAIAGLLLVLAAVAVRQRWTAALVALQVAGLLQLAPLVPRLPTPLFAEPAPWIAAIAPRRAVASAAWAIPPWQPAVPLPRQPSDLAAVLRPAPGILHGLTYPTAPDLEGLASPFHTFLMANLGLMPWQPRLNWLRVLGAEAVVAYDSLQLPGLVLRDVLERSEFTARLYLVETPAPPGWWPGAVAAAENPVAALRAVGRAADPLQLAVVPWPIDHQAGGHVEPVIRSADRIELAVESAGGLAVVRRAYHPMWRARAAGRELATLPANLVLLGVVVPPGRHQVVLEVAHWPEVVAGAMALAALAAALVVTGRRRGVNEIRAGTEARPYEKHGS
ncbi:MAG TPA: hypothetical protein VFE44_09065, partial [Thermoanaerobaculia bacterium]|nr:hypothetical protein [Thermoanaerobaculia bacterium]